MSGRQITIQILMFLLLVLSCSSDPTSAGSGNNPVTSITSPANNSEFDEGALINIKADATDEDSVKEVRFYFDDVLKSTDTAEPWEYLWNSSGQSGSHILFVRAIDKNDNMGESEKITITVNNGVPTASFTVLPSSGDTSTVFQVDASASSDREDPANALQVRWDWEDDGIWDTDYSTIKTASHKYDTEGTKIIRLEVQDTHGQTDTTSMAVAISIDTGNPGIVTDIDGNEYTTVKIGNQWWLVENLKVTHYRDGTTIPLVFNPSSWALATQGAYCYYDLSASNTAAYGLLYNFHAVDNAKGLAPEGWHVASSDEWKEMEMYLGMTQEEADKTLWRGTDEGGKLKETGITHWNTPNTGATNETGFTAIPGGYRRGDNANFEGINTIAYFWTSTGTTASNNTYALTRALTSTDARISFTGSQRVWGFSVRCVKD